MFQVFTSGRNFIGKTRFGPVTKNLPAEFAVVGVKQLLFVAAGRGSRHGGLANFQRLPFCLHWL